MSDAEFIKTLKKLLEKKNQKVADIEMTSGNYDEEGILITEKIPTITTEFCEIGRYKHKITYFVFILNSSQFTKNLFNMISKYKNMKIYGFKNFLVNFYPKKGFLYSEFEEEIKEEKYIQIQFSSNRKQSKPEYILKKYLELKEIFISTYSEVIDQIKINLAAL